MSDGLYSAEFIVSVRDSGRNVVDFLDPFEDLPKAPKPVFIQKGEASVSQEQNEDKEKKK